MYSFTHGNEITAKVGHFKCVLKNYMENSTFYDELLFGVENPNCCLVRATQLWSLVMLEITFIYEG